MIISVPTIYSCKLPNGNWINLAQVRQLETTIGRVKVTWMNGDSENFHGDNANAILQAWQEASGKYSKGHKHEN